MGHEYFKHSEKASDAIDSLNNTLITFATAAVLLGFAVSFDNKKYRYLTLVVGIITFIVAVVAAYFLIPINGLLGLGVAYLVRRGLYFFGLALVSRNYFRVNYPKSTLLLIPLIMAISAGIGTILYFFGFSFLTTNNSILVSFTISTVIFGLLVMATKSITKEDINFVLGLFKNYFGGLIINLKELFN